MAYAITSSRNLMMIAESCYIPKENKDKPAGEDAHFFCESAQVIGVADGVGGWASHGIDAGEYARELMKNAEYEVKDYSPVDVDPKEVLRQAFLNTAEEGSSTACIISLAGDILTAANVGDSGFTVIRGGRTFYRSPVQQYGFNFPYQLQKSSEDNGAEQAEEMVVEMESGDVVVAGTDGLFDNLFPDDIEKIVRDYCSDSMLSLAETLATAALERSEDTTTVSPFEVAAYEAGKRYLGGKYDDITVVVARVVPAGSISSYEDDDHDDDVMALCILV
ncbi:hypothetical protein ACP275_10G165700 [Erythranthe tilingii]